MAKHATDFFLTFIVYLCHFGVGSNPTVATFSHLKVHIMAKSKKSTKVANAVAPCTEFITLSAKYGIHTIKGVNYTRTPEGGFIDEQGNARTYGQCLDGCNS